MTESGVDEIVKRQALIRAAKKTGSWGEPWLPTPWKDMAYKFHHHYNRKLMSEKVILFHIKCLLNRKWKICFQISLLVLSFFKFCFFFFKKKIVILPFSTKKKEKLSLSLFLRFLKISYINIVKVAVGFW